MILYYFFKIILIVLILYLVIPTVRGFRNGAGPLITPQKNIRKVLEYIELRPNQKLYDLGAGFGGILIVGAKYFRADVYGFEISPFIFFIAKINLFLNGIKNYTLYRKNFYNQDLSQAEVIYCFTSQKDMNGMRKKFSNDVRSGTWIISYGFPIEDYNPIKIFDFDNPGKMYVYRMLK